MGAQQSTAQDKNEEELKRPRVESIFSAPSLDLDRFCFSSDSHNVPMIQAINSELDQITPIDMSSTGNDSSTKAEPQLVQLKPDTTPEVRMAIETRGMTRTVRRLRRLSVAYVENKSLVASLTMPSLAEIFSFCSDATKQNIHDSCEYFAKLIDTSRQELEIYTDEEDWLELLRVSPYLKRLTIHGELSPDDILAINSLIKFNCLPDLNYLYLDDVGEVAIIDILNNIELKLAYLHSKHNLIAVDGLGNKTLSLTINTPSMRKLTAKSIASSLNGSIHYILTQFSLHTLDGAGLVELFKDLELYQFKNLNEVNISQCNMCRKSFEMFVRSLWPEFVDPIAFVPITKLRLEDCGLNDACVESLVHALNRGAGVNVDVFDISSNRITRNGIKALAQPFQNYQLPNLKCFYVSNNWSGHGGIAHILDVLKEGVSPNLQELEIDRMGLGIKDMNSLNEYVISPFFTQMYRLNIRNNPDMINGLSTFFDNLIVSNNRNLGILFLENTGIRDNEIRKMVKWFDSGNAQQLQYLFLKGNAITGFGFKKLLDSLVSKNTPNLKVLDVSSNEISNIFIETNDYMDQIDVQEKSSSYELNRSFEQIARSSPFSESLNLNPSSGSQENINVILGSPQNNVKAERFSSSHFRTTRTSMMMDVIDSDDSSDSNSNAPKHVSLVSHNPEDDEITLVSDKTPTSLSPAPQSIHLDENQEPCSKALPNLPSNTIQQQNVDLKSDDEEHESIDSHEDYEEEISTKRPSFQEKVGSPEQPIHQFPDEFYHTSTRVNKSKNIGSLKSSYVSTNSDGRNSVESISSITSEYRKNWNLIQLEVSYNPFTDRDIIGLFDILKKHCNLEYLEDIGFDEGKFTSLGFRTIFESLTLDKDSALNRIDIFSGSGSTCGPAIRSFLESRFADHMNILQLRDCHLSKQDCYDVLSAFETDKYPKKLQKLFLTGNPEFCDDHIFYIIKLLKADKIPSSFIGLNASYTCVTEEGLDALFEYYSTYPNTSLRKFIFEGINMDSESRRLYQDKFEQQTNCKLVL